MCLAEESILDHLTVLFLKRFTYIELTLLHFVQELLQNSLTAQIQRAHRLSVPENNPLNLVKQRFLLLVILALRQKKKLMVSRQKLQDALNEAVIKNT